MLEVLQNQIIDFQFINWYQENKTKFCGRVASKYYSFLGGITVDVDCGQYKEKEKYAAPP